MHEYYFFGRRIRSDLDFPEIAPTPAPDLSPELRLVRMSGDPPGTPSPESLLGRTTVGKGVDVALFREGPGFLLRFADSGVFHIAENEISWWPGENADLEAVRVDVKGRVIPLALHLGGLVCLHAGAVVASGAVIGFVGPKRAGKSTLTAALVSRGAGFVTDDVLALDSGSPPLAFPGVPSFRLWEDSERSVGLSAEYRETGLAGKLNVRPAEEGFGRAPSYPISAIYMLVPEAPSEVQQVRRRRIPHTEAAMLLVANVKNGELLGGPEGAWVFQRAVGLVNSLPCYELRVPRDLNRLAETTSEILRWASEEWEESEPDDVPDES